jgi:hypothetical protein
MNHDEVQARLRDLSRGDLSAAEQKAVAEHLEQCAECSRDLAALENVVTSRLDTLPRDVPPSRDLWLDIDARLAKQARAAGEAEPSVPWWRWVLRPATGVAFASAAAVVVLFLTLRQGPIDSGRTALDTLPREHPFREQPAPSLQTTAQLEPTVRALESECTALGKQILATLTGPPTMLTASTALTFQENLAQLDRAIVETYAALAKYPGDPALMRRLTDHYQRKLGLLHHAAQLASEFTA